MATIPLKPPNPFDFKHPDDWQKWKRRFDQYRHASGLASENEQQQVRTLLYCLGEQADHVYLQLVFWRRIERSILK